MPWIHLSAARPISPAEMERLKGELANALLEVLRKEERGLFFTFRRIEFCYRAGEKVEDAGVVDLRYIGSYGLPEKQELTRRISRLLAGALALDPQKVIVLFTEMASENWGRNEGDYT